MAALIQQNALDDGPWYVQGIFNCKYFLNPLAKWRTVYYSRFSTQNGRVLNRPRYDQYGGVSSMAKKQFKAESKRLLDLMIN